MPLDGGNGLRGLWWQSGSHPREKALASRDNDRAIDLDVELAHFPADDLNLGVKPAPKLVGHRERPPCQSELRHLPGAI